MITKDPLSNCDYDLEGTCALGAWRRRTWRAGRPGCSGGRTWRGPRRRCVSRNPFTPSLGRPVVQGKLVLAGGVWVPSISQCWRHVAIDERAVSYSVLRGQREVARCCVGRSGRQEGTLEGVPPGGPGDLKNNVQQDQRCGWCGVCDRSDGSVSHNYLYLSPQSIYRDTS